jgi:hypothetical protein
MPSEIQAMMDCKKRKPNFGKNKKKERKLLILQDSHQQYACNMYPFVGGEFKPLERCTKHE